MGLHWQNDAAPYDWQNDREYADTLVDALAQADDRRKAAKENGELAEVLKGILLAGAPVPEDAA